MSSRRRILAALGAMPWIAPRVLGAESKLIGALFPFEGVDSEAGLRSWLKKFRYPEAETARIVVLRSDGQDAAIPKLALDLVALRPAVIVAWGDVAAQALQAATSTIPIVVMTDDLGKVGRIGSLGRPGGNMTGISVLATELDAKRLELLALLLPPRSEVMLLADATTLPLSRAGVRRTGESLGLRLREATVRSADEARLAIATARSKGVAGVNVLASPHLYTWSDSIIRWVNEARLPAIFEWGSMADEGALIAYGPLLDPLYRRMLEQIVGILRGGRVADFPVEQPTLFELAINLKTAKAIGVSVPSALLLRADRVIPDA